MNTHHLSDNSETNYLNRRLASMSDREKWESLRLKSVTATDVSLLAKESSIPSILSKKFESSFYGNKYTSYGNYREPFIAEWVKNNHNVLENDFVFHAAEEARHLATPDGINLISNEVILSEIKTTNKPFSKVPLRYLRQIYWQQYVLGASRTLFAWEEHKDFVPIGEPKSVWVERDDEVISNLVKLSNILLDHIDALS